MEKLVTLTSTVLPLPIDNLDTDQIMPKQFLHGIDKSGLAHGCFYNMRFGADGKALPDSIFNRPGFDKAQIVLAGPNFGCGSSREHAVWGMMQLGFRVVIAPSFGEIYYSNCFNNGLLCAKVSLEDMTELFALVSDRTPTAATVSVEKQTITVAGKVFPFTLAARHRTMLLEGLDMLETTMKDLDLIRAFKAKHEQEYPWMAGLAGKAKRKLDRL